MNYDIDLCANKQCRIKKTCERYVSSVKDLDPRHIWWTRFTPEKDKLHCSHYIKKERDAK